jgi:hypothetical protein
MSGPTNPFAVLADRLSLNAVDLEKALRDLGLVLTFSDQEARHAEWLWKFQNGTLNERKTI